jgi:hypothetical protein
MALPATDAFTDTNGTVLTSHSGGVTWSGMTGASTGCEVQTNAAQSSGAGNGGHNRDSGNTYNNDQYAQITTTNAAGDKGQIGPAVRCASGAFTKYGYEITANGREFYKRVAGTYTGLGATFVGATAVDGDVVRLEANGTTITPKLNGSIDSGHGAVTDSSIASGSAGIGGWWDGTVSSTRAADWEGGNLGAATGPTFVQLERITRGLERGVAQKGL